MLRQSFYDLYLYIDLLIHVNIKWACNQNRTVELFTSTLYLAHKQISEHVKFYSQRESKLVYIYNVFLHQNINPRSVAMAIVWVLLDCSILYELICHRQKEEEADYTLLVKNIKKYYWRWIHGWST